MEKRYQVFVSSTYTDLVEERKIVSEAIMMLNCIPAGMEMFPAVDDTQFNFIKRIIDDCDYYVLIIGGRYGAVSETGLSYTEMEYDYAIEKGIRVMALIHSKPFDIAAGKSESDKTILEKLENFKSKVTTNRLVKYWDDKSQLATILTSSLSITMRMYPAVGWVRANQIPSQAINDELAIALKQNRELKEELNTYKSTIVGKPLIDVFANESKEVKIFIRSIKGSTLCVPVNKDEMPDDILKNLPPNYIKEYNGSINLFKKEADDYNEQVTLKVHSDNKVEFKVVNTGSSKAKTLHVDIAPSVGLKMYDINGRPSLSPKWPKNIPAHPKNKAYEFAFSHLGKFVKKTQSQLLAIDHQPFDKDRWQLIRDNNLTIYRHELLHTRSSYTSKFILVASEPGEYQLDVSCICEEFHEPQLTVIKVIAIAK